jgi:hypothetical protein
MGPYVLEISRTEYAQTVLRLYKFGAYSSEICGWDGIPMPSRRRVHASIKSFKNRF